MLAGLTRNALDEDYAVWTGCLPDPLMPDQEAFEALWALHPDDFWEIMLHGRKVKTPRWQQAYGRDYVYSGQVNRALPVPAEMAALLTWVRERLDPRLNGILLNWYDGEQGHYIGKHRDSIKGMLEGAPIVTLSLGETRAFRMRPWKGKGFVDFLVPHGSLLVIPYDTNLAWTHEVPHARAHTKRRISLTFRAFEAGAAEL